jgi:hypothetical protein
MSHPKREQIIQLEVEATMQAYLIGFMAQKGWIEKNEAQQSAFIVGRTLRDRVRALGVSFDNLRATLGTTMNSALEDIIKLDLASLPNGEVRRNVFVLGAGS